MRLSRAVELNSDLFGGADLVLALIDLDPFLRVDEANLVETHVEEDCDNAGVPAFSVLFGTHMTYKNLSH